jgi:uncharacterized hydrophobic protein (TIGR00271 family)
MTPMDYTAKRTSFALARNVAKFRFRFERMLGVESHRKKDLYLELSRGATLFDLVYWLQILFSSGIATLGLVMNSPAVIIGAMLISPLMGPILAAGLALASGDVILGVRALAKIFLSCGLAVVFAVVLVALLPFREMTNEIAARTQPNTLDLFIALFSGLVGSIAVCRDVKGIATSIPGVAIAVALMPPLCVAGYGIGLVVTLDPATGWRIASGGGLLFLTNLVAITFTAMIVFLVVRLSTAEVKKSAETWEHNDPESAFLLNFMERFPRLEQAREIRSLPIRFAMIVLPLAVILVPLSQTFNQLRTEIKRERRTNELRKEVLTLWQANFQSRTDGAARSTVDKLSVDEQEGELQVELRVFDDEPYTSAEKKEFAKLLGAKLGRPVDSIKLRLLEIPTTTVLSSLRDRERELSNLNFSSIQSRLWNQVDTAIDQVELPLNATLVGRKVLLDGGQKLQISLTYLCDTNFDPAMEKSVIDNVRANLHATDASIKLERVPVEVGLIEFPQRSTTLTVLGMLQLDFVGRLMRENPTLALIISTGSSGEANSTLEAQRFQSVADYMATRWQVQPDRLETSEQPQRGGRMLLQFRIRTDSSEEAADSGNVEARDQ